MILDLFGIIYDYLYTPPSKLLDWVDIGRLEWLELSINPAAIHLLEANLDKADWSWLSWNTAAIHILEANLDKVDWASLSRNPAAIHILEANLDKIVWWNLSTNPNIFMLDKNKYIGKKNRFMKLF